jgi:hypothetical protein
MARVAQAIECDSKPAIFSVRGAIASEHRFKSKLSFALGFLTGQEMDWLPEAMRILRDELPNMEVTVSSQYSPQLADALARDKLDVLADPTVRQAVKTFSDWPSIPSFTWTAPSSAAATSCWKCHKAGELAEALVIYRVTAASRPT